MSALIFVALAVAWAAYLVPKALRHHEDVADSRSVERFSDTMRVLARREPVDARSARLVVTPGRPASAAVAVPAGMATPAPVAATAPEPAAEPAPGPAAAAPAEARARREATNRAARRRRRVLLTILLANLVVAGLAGFAVISWWYVAAPAGLLVAWLVACRVMVRHERGIARRHHPVRAAARAVAAVVPGMGDTGTHAAVAAEDLDATQDVPVVGGIEVTAEARVDPALWDPVPVTLPTYVTKPAATRTVRTIDLDGTGVWTSGRTEADSQIAREAEQAERDERAARSDDEVRRATGS